MTSSKCILETTGTARSLALPDAVSRSATPLDLDRVRVLEVAGRRLKVGPLEAIDGTPVIDIKPVLSEAGDS